MAKATTIKIAIYENGQTAADVSALYDSNFVKNFVDTTQNFVMIDSLGNLYKFQDDGSGNVQVHVNNDTDLYYLGNGSVGTTNTQLNIFAQGHANIGANKENYSNFSAMNLGSSPSVDINSVKVIGNGSPNNVITYEYIGTESGIEINKLNGNNGPVDLTYMGDNLQISGNNVYIVNESNAFTHLSLTVNASPPANSKQVTKYMLDLLTDIWNTIQVTGFDGSTVFITGMDAYGGGPGGGGGGEGPPPPFANITDGISYNDQFFGVNPDASQIDAMNAPLDFADVEGSLQIINNGDDSFLQLPVGTYNAVLSGSGYLDGSGPPETVSLDDPYTVTLILQENVTDEALMTVEDLLNLVPAPPPDEGPPPGDDYGPPPGDEGPPPGDDGNENNDIPLVFNPDQLVDNKFSGTFYSTFFQAFKTAANNVNITDGEINSLNHIDIIGSNDNKKGVMKGDAIDNLKPDSYETYNSQQKHRISKSIMKKLMTEMSSVLNEHVFEISKLDLNHTFRNKTRVRSYPQNSSTTIDISTLQNNEGFSVPHMVNGDQVTILNGAETTTITKVDDNNYTINDGTSDLTNQQDGSTHTFGALSLTLGSVTGDSDTSGGSSGDPYITSVNNKVTKLPDQHGFYCLFSNDNMFINVEVDYQDITEQMNTYCKTHNLDYSEYQNHEIITKGYWNRTLWISSENNTLTFDLFTKHMTFESDYFKYSVKRNDFKYDKLGDKTISKSIIIEWKHSKFGPQSFVVDFYANPQIENSIRFNSNLLLSKKSTGLLVSNYKAKLMKLKKLNDTNIKRITNKITNIKNTKETRGIKKIGEIWTRGTK